MGVKPLSEKIMIKQDKAHFQIRSMTANDLERVLQIETVCDLPVQSISDLERDLSDPTALLFVAFKMEEILGFVSARLITSIVEILNIGICPKARRQGIGEALVQKILQRANKSEAVESWLEVRESNQTAQKFYFSFGYKIVGCRPNYYSNPNENAILMTLVFSDYNPKK